MTTKPKARKFRIRRAAPATPSDAAGSAPAAGAKPVRPVAPVAPAAASSAATSRPAVARSAETSPPQPARPPRPAAQPGAASSTAARPAVGAVPVDGDGLNFPRPSRSAAEAAEASNAAGLAGVTQRRAADLARRQAEAEAALRSAVPPTRPTPPQPGPAAETPVPQQPQAAQPQPPRPDHDPIAETGVVAAREGEIASPREVRADLDIDSIRKEGLTGRQLRMARRVAQKHGLAPTSDFDAVRQLRSRGIDPFERSNMLQLVVPDSTGSDPSGRVQLPQTVPVGAPGNLPSTELRPADRRATEISKLQQDLALRRRRRMFLMFTRLFFFVFAPTILAGWYFYVVATPMYAAKSEFLILQADSQGGGGLGGLLSGTQFATNQDSIAVQSYLQSKDAMLRLDRDVGFKSHFTQPWIDPIQRLDENPSNEEAYKIFKRNVKIGYDPTEGVIRMEIAAADPAVAAQFSESLITYAEQRVDDLSRRKREDGMRTARESLEKAKAERREAQERLVQLQEGTIVDPEGIIAGLRAQINNVELQLQEKDLQLSALLDNARPNQARVQGAQGDVDRLQTLLDDLNRRMTNATSGETSLAAKAAQIQMAQADLATADLFLQSALQNEKQTELEANRQVRYLTTSVRPVPPEDPTYPRAFENTVLAFLIFSGVYLMISLTASILREQVSA